MQSNSSDKYVYRYNIKILNLLDPRLQFINTKPMIKNKLKELLSELKKLKVQTILVLEYKKRNYKIFHSSAKLIASDSEIEGMFKSTHQSIMTKIKSSTNYYKPLIISIFLCYFSSLQDPFFYFFCFRNILMYILNITSAIKRMTFNELRDFIFENYYTRTGFLKETSYY